MEEKLRNLLVSLFFFLSSAFLYMEDFKSALSTDYLLSKELLSKLPFFASYIYFQKFYKPENAPWKYGKLILVFVVVDQIVIVNVYKTLSLPDKNVINVIMVEDEIQKYFQENEGIDIVKDPLNSCLNQRPDSALFTWSGDRTRLGHVSLGLTLRENNTTQIYISHWPREESTARFKLLKDFRPSGNLLLKDDIEAEGGYPDHVIVFKRGVLDEVKVRNWFLNSADTEEYHLFLKNCVSLVNAALRVGGVEEEGIITQYMFSTDGNAIFPWLYPCTICYANSVVEQFLTSGYPWIDCLYQAHQYLVQILAGIYITAWVSRITPLLITPPLFDWIFPQRPNNDLIK